ncbi:MAG TPA: hypothetical protein P5556_05095 [Candidatus Gastranaerophilales bacterium]|nr:hypothetical protein [Candidatus Gastranaerophilales bacterium]
MLINQIRQQPTIQTPLTQQNSFKKIYSPKKEASFDGYTKIEPAGVMIKHPLLRKLMFAIMSRIQMSPFTKGLNIKAQKEIEIPNFYTKQKVAATKIQGKINPEELKLIFSSESTKQPYVAGAQEFLKSGFADKILQGYEKSIF